VAPLRADTDLLARLDSIISRADLQGEQPESASAEDTIKVLYVEDVSDMRRMVAFTLPLMKSTFPAAGWPPVEVIEANDGLDGVAKAKEHMPDVIIIDMQLPGLSGTETATRMREDPQTSHIPIILSSAFREERVEEAAKQVGAELAMHKPFQWDQLMRAIVGLAHRRR
jgi:CheY-like chemotaxis protein